MKSHARTIALFLLLGALTTVALAWMFAAVGSVGRIQETFRGVSAVIGASGQSPELRWPPGTPGSWPEPTWAASGNGRGTWAESASGARSSEGEIAVFQITVVRFGWPLAALQWRQGGVSDSAQRMVQRIGGGRVMLPDWVERLPFRDSLNNFPWRRQLPVEPVWPGFALDALLYAVGLWLLLRACGALRRALRSRRHQCLACGYPIGASTLCTECGRPVAGAPV